MSKRIDLAWGMLLCNIIVYAEVHPYPLDKTLVLCGKLRVMLAPTSIIV